jgi:hypothetical protein
MIANMGNVFQNARFGQGFVPQFDPIGPLATGDKVVNRLTAVVLDCQMPVFHFWLLCILEGFPLIILGFDYVLNAFG